MIVDSHQHVMLPTSMQIKKMDDAGVDKAILFTTTLMLRGPQLRLWMQSALKCKCCTNSCPAAILPKREYQK